MEQRMRGGEKDKKNKGEGEVVWELISVVVIGHSRSQSTTEDSPQCLNIAFRVLCWDNFLILKLYFILIIFIYFLS